MIFTAAERAYLTAQPLGRMATIGPDGAPQAKPLAYHFDPETDTIDIGGPSLSTSQKFRNVQADPRVSFIVDDMADEPVGPGGQTGRGLEIRGDVEILIGDGPLLGGFSDELLRIHPRRVIAWNIDRPGANIRNVPSDTARSAAQG